VDYWVGGLSITLRPGLQCWGAWSPSLDGDLDPVTGVKRVGLVCARGTDEACVFQGTQLGTLIRVSPFLRDGTSWLLSSTVVITGT
jgi:hypothetical protein